MRDLANPARDPADQEPIRGIQAFSAQALSHIVWQRTRLAELEGDYGAHSLRSGFVTEAGRRNVRSMKRWPLPATGVSLPSCADSSPVLYSPAAATACGPFDPALTRHGSHS
jgi:hypothetical protein